MLYLEDDSRSLWPPVARALASLEPLEMVLCRFPDSAPSEPPALFSEQGSLLRLDSVLTYPEGITPLCSARVPVDEELLTWLESLVDELEDWGEWLALYRPRRPEIVAAVIPHEGIILVSDEFGSAIAAAGYRLSDDRPDWWQQD